MFDSPFAQKVIKANGFTDPKYSSLTEVTDEEILKQAIVRQQKKFNWDDALAKKGTRDHLQWFQLNDTVGSGFKIPNNKVTDAAMVASVERTVVKVRMRTYIYLLKT
jgi:hypothetical protein